MEKRYIAVDLHCHSTYSDGSLSVRDVLELAKTNGVRYQALTDHDTVEGIREARHIAKELDFNLIAGVEISVTWQNNNLIHILGLGVNENDPTLVANLSNLRSSRIDRARRIGDNLAKVGIKGAFEGAMALCKNPEAISRTHFNHWLVAEGYARPGKAFEKFLAQGKPAYTSQTWASLEDALNWITSSGGIAVIAHPGRYKFTRTKLIKLIDEFKSYGGVGIELISSSHSLNDEENIAAICRQCNLLASLGSDFHQTESYHKILPGKNKAIPYGINTVFERLGIVIADS